MRNKSVRKRQHLYRKIEQFAVPSKQEFYIYNHYGMEHNLISNQENINQSII